MDDSAAIVQSPLDRAGYCIRRSLIDPWLQDAAEEAGAEFRDQHRVVELLREGDRVTGVVARGPSGTTELRAGIVVGADGMHSTIAKLTKAPEYLVTDSSRAGYWGYFPAPSEWKQPWDATLEHIGSDIRYVFRCDNGLLTVVYVGEKEEVAGWGKEYKERFLSALRASKTTRELVDGKEPEGKIIGALKIRFFYRDPVGPGYALVGDAGHFKDFVTGQGMADAFLDAERLSHAILDGRQEAFTHYWRERDVATLPLHFDAIRQGTVGHNTPFMQWVTGRMLSFPEIAKRVPLMLDRKITPGEMIPMSNMLRMMGAALVRGRFDVLSGFMKMGRELQGETAELERRKALLVEATRSLEAAPKSADRLAVAA